MCRKGDNQQVPAMRIWQLADSCRVRAPACARPPPSTHFQSPNALLMLKLQLRSLHVCMHASCEGCAFHHLSEGAASSIKHSCGFRLLGGGGRFCCLREVYCRSQFLTDKMGEHTHTPGHDDLFAARPRPGLDLPSSHQDTLHLAHMLCGVVLLTQLIDLAGGRQA